jgi:hypothetical protein
MTSNQKVAVIWLPHNQILKQKNKWQESPHIYQYWHRMSMDSTFKRHHLTNSTKKKDLTICYLQETDLTTEINTGLGWKLEEYLPSYSPPKQAAKLRQSTLQTYIGQMRQRRTLHSNKRCNTIINLSIQWCTQCQCTQFHQKYSKGFKSRYILQHSDSGALNTSLSLINNSSKQKIIKDILELNDTIGQKDLVDI